jgi:hypothetical protein
VNKKKQKNFAPRDSACDNVRATRNHQSNKSFLVLFFKKGLLSFASAATLAATHNDEMMRR